MSEAKIKIIADAVAVSRRKRALGIAIINDAIYLAKDTETAIGDIAGTLGSDSPQLSEAATTVASEMLNIIITVLNRPSKDRLHDLSDARKALTFISKLPVSASFTETRLMPQRSLIIEMMRHYGVPDRDADIDFSPLTGDDAFFSTCSSADDFSRYLRRHPEGGHTEEANRAISRLRAADKRRQAIVKTSLQVGSLLLAVLLLVAVCTVAGISSGITAGLSLLLVGIAAGLMFFRTFGADATSTFRQRCISGAVSAIFLCAGAGIILTSDRHAQRLELDDILAHSDEDALVAYICNPRNTYYSDEAVAAYLEIMDSVFFDPERMAKPSQAPPLARMANLAKAEELSEATRKILEDRVKLRTDSLYHISLAYNDLDSWLNYQALAPDELYYDSSERIDSIETVCWSSEPTAWESATRQGTREGYTRYLDLFPDGIHASAANQRLIDIEVNDYRNQGHVTVESISRIAESSRAGSIVCIYNNSDYDVKFMFSGPASASYTVPAHGYDEHQFADGDYQVLALISNPQRDRFSFPQTLDRGIYSSTIEINDKPTSPE